MQSFTTIFISIMLLSIGYIHLENKKSDVDYVVSKIDNRKYIVQNQKDKQQAADNLAIIRKNLVMLVQELKKKNAKVAITLALIAFAIYAGFMLIQM